MTHSDIDLSGDSPATNGRSNRIRTSSSKFGVVLWYIDDSIFHTLHPFLVVRDAQKYANIAHLLQIRQEQDRRNLVRELNEFRRVSQQPKDAREHDLKHRASISLGNDSTVEGEDPCERDRSICQQEQMQQWQVDQVCVRFRSSDRH